VRYSWIGITVSALAALVAGYELLAQLTPLPTISRVIQGWRDDGHTVAVVTLVSAITLVLLVFAAWVFRHLLFGDRSVLLP
jgi:hypothetical protein